MSSMRVTTVEQQFGAQVRAVRLGAGLSQEELARLANVSRGAVVSLESGAGSSLATLVKVLGAVDRTAWLFTLQAPEPPFNPLDLLDGGAAAPRPRARVRRSRSSAAEQRQP